MRTAWLCGLAWVLALALAAGSAVADTRRGTIEHDGLQRSYLVHVPARYDASRPVPLLIALHGGGGHMAYQADDERYGLVSKAEREGFIVVFPNGYSRLPRGRLATWNAGDCCGASRDRGIDDLGFLRRLIERVQGEFAIDRERVFATGMSNGAMMAHRLACELPHTVRAIAAVAGTDNTRRCDPAQPVSVLMIHARNDDHVAFGGGRGPKAFGDATTEFNSVPETLERWKRRNRCDGPPRRVLERPGAQCELWSGCADGSRVQLCMTDDGGHSWPGGRKDRAAEAPSQALSANDVMWDFFMRR